MNLWVKDKSQDGNSKNPANVDSLINDSMFNSSQVHLQNTIRLYDEQTLINSYQNREEFIQQYSQLQQKIEDKKKQLKSFDHQEVVRIVREFDFKDYLKKYNIDCGSVLGALFGGKTSDKLLIRYGMLRKQ